MSQLFGGSNDHGHNRRLFLQGGMASALGVSLGGMHASYDPLWAEELRKQQKHVLLLWLAGGSSQMETWDPKPGRPTGGPFKSIPTAATGVHICELLPKMAKLMNRVAVVRSLDTRVGDHGGATKLVETGRGREPGVDYPELGTVIGKELAQRESKVPDYVSLYLATEGHRRPNPGFLGGRYAALHLNKSLKPENIELPTGLTEVEHSEREALRRFLRDRFDSIRKASKVKGYNSSYARVQGLMDSSSPFDL